MLLLREQVQISFLYHFPRLPKQTKLYLHFIIVKNKETKKLWSSLSSYWDLGTHSKSRSRHLIVSDCLYAKKRYSMPVSLWHRVRDEWSWKGPQGVILIHFSMFFPRIFYWSWDNCRTLLISWELLTQRYLDPQSIFHERFPGQHPSLGRSRGKDSPRRGRTCESTSEGKGRRKRVSVASQQGLRQAASLGCGVALNIY